MTELENLSELLHFCPIPLAQQIVLPTWAIQRRVLVRPVLQLVLFTGQTVPDNGVFRLLGEHYGEGFDFRLDHGFILNRLDSTDPLKLFFGMLRPLRATARDHTS